MAGYQRFRTRVISKNDVKQVPDEELEGLYMWVDGIPLSRPKRNLCRDFADGVMIAELVHHFIPALVDKHNYPSANSAKAKKENWCLFDRKVLTHLGIELKDDVINIVINAQPWAIEKILLILRDKIDMYLSDQKNSLRPEADQNGGGATSYAQGGGGGHGGGFNKSQSLQNLSHPRRKNEKVPIQQLIEKENLIAQQTDTIQMLTEKIHKLEHLCDLKDTRIDEMTDKLQQLQSTRRPGRAPRGSVGYGGSGGGKPPQPGGGGYARPPPQQQPQGRWN